MGLDVYMRRHQEPEKLLHDDAEGTEYERGEDVALPSKVYPDHLFKVGYMRSSYNDGGIDKILSERIGTRLNQIFEQPDHEYIQLRPAWGEAKCRAARAIADLKAYAETHGTFKVWTVTHNYFSGVARVNRAEALQLFHEQREGWKKKPPTSESYGYTTAGGAYMPGGLKVHAAVVGVDTLGSQGVHLIYEEDGGFDWYIQALEIVIEMCEWAMGQPEREKLVLCWSG